MPPFRHGVGRAAIWLPTLVVSSTALWLRNGPILVLVAFVAGVTLTVFVYRRGRRRRRISE
jgi:Flp pilus assembly protein TadB